ncbi:hypothetical protein H8E88_30050 [candidate division KSB1 bacterium]|nr:hypothetical protein [candidate division KSB1 bacterium]
MNKVRLLISIILLFISNVFAQDRYNIAVIDLDAEGITQSESRIITDRLRTNLFITGKFVVLERDKMEEILNEQGFQLSGCTSDECVIEIGKLTGVQQIVVGSIGKIGKLYTINTRIIDIETGKVLNIAIDDCECTIETVLTKSIKNVAKRLSGKNSYYKNTSLSYNDPQIISKKNNRSYKSIYLSPRIGISLYTGAIGLELTYKKYAVGIGNMIGVNWCGAKYYLKSGKKSYYIGAFGAIDIDIIGLMIGHRWRFKNNCELKLGTGILQEDYEYILPAIDLTIGYSFQF